MLEVIIERWDDSDGSTSYLWSLWQTGRRISMGERVKLAADAKHEAIDYCRSRFGAPPDRVREL